MQDDIKWITKNGVHIPITNEYMNDKIRNISNIKTQRDKIKYINEKYEEKLRYPISAIKVKKFWTGDQKTGKYEWQYTADTKSGQMIATNSLEELDERLNKAIYK